MAIRPIFSGSSLIVAKPRLLISRFALGASRADSPTASITSPVDQDASALARLEKLVASLRNVALDAVASGGGKKYGTSQGKVDGVLGEISALLGTQLQLGGSQNAVVKGLNAAQIESYEIRTLRPNATANFSGSFTRTPGRLSSFGVVKQEASSRVNFGPPQVRGLNSTQIVALDASRLTRGTPAAITGSRTQQAAVAELAYQGQAGAVAAGSATFRLTGEFGSATINTTEGESLVDFAQRINAVSAVTGVAAEIVGDAIALRSASKGTAAFVAIDNVARDSNITTSNLNEAQVANLDIVSLPAEAQITIAGTITQAGDFARQTYHGAPGALVAGTATFTLTGSLGDAQIEIAAGESLAAVAQRINDASATTGVRAEVVGDDLEIESIAQGSAALLRIDNVVRDTDLSVTGVNGTQVEAFDVLAIPDGIERTLTGTITQSADFARQTYHGAAGAVVVDSATFTLTGSAGSAQVTITQGEALASVAQRINDLTSTTGVAAATNGNDLIISSAAVGSAESLQIELENITQYVSVAGVNAAQITQFQVTSAAAASTNVLNGTVTQAATRGTLTYTGASNRTTSSATFTLTGALGSTTISVNNSETLNSVRNKINAVTASTGVSATRSGNILTISSSDYGTTAFVDVDVTAGTFNTTGGDGNGHAAGLDALLTINGNSLTGAGNNVAYTDSLGSYQLTLATGFTGSLSTVTVTSANGTFDVTGGNQTGTAYGRDAAATINGQALVAVGNDFYASIDDLEFTFSAAQGYSGAIDLITVASVFDAFDLTGGDQSGTAYGLDAEAIINGQAVTAAGREFQLSIGGAEFVLTAADGFAGELEPITVTSTLDDFTIVGGDGNGLATGSDSLATINGVEFTSLDDTFDVTTASGLVRITFAEGFLGMIDPIAVTYEPRPARPSRTTTDAAVATSTATINGLVVAGIERRYLVAQNGVEIELQFVDGFSGEFDPFTVTAAGNVGSEITTSPLSQARLESARAALADLFALASGGEFAGLGARSGHALNTTLDALSRLGQLTGNAAQFAKRSILGSVLDQSI